MAARQSLLNVELLAIPPFALQQIRKENLIKTHSERGVRLLLLFCVIMWGWTFVATKICVSYMSPFELVGLRFLVGIPLLMVIVLAKRISLTVERGQGRRLMIGATIIAVHFLIQPLALVYTSATNTGWIIAVTPLAIAILSYLVLKEAVGLREILGIVVATGGVALLVSKGHFHDLRWLRSFGDWLILVSAFTWAAYTIVTRDVARRVNPLVVAILVFTPVTLIGLGYLTAKSSWAVIASLPSEAIVALVFLGVIGSLTQWFWQEGIARIGATKAGVFLYLEPLATTALAIPLLNESFGLFTAIGGLMVLTGVWIAQRAPSAG